MILLVMILASLGCSRRKWYICSETISSTAGRTSEETNFSLVCEENFGSGTLTETTAVNPSRMSSPERSTLCFFKSSCSAKYWFNVRVKAARKPVKWVPPSFWGILLVKQKTCSAKVCVHCKAHSSIIPLRFPSIWQIVGCKGSRCWFKYSTKALTPPP